MDLSRFKFTSIVSSRRPIGKRKDLQRKQIDEWDECNHRPERRETETVQDAADRIYNGYHEDCEKQPMCNAVLCPLRVTRR